MSGGGGGEDGRDPAGTVTGRRTVRFETGGGAAAPRAALERLRTSQPADLAGHRVERVRPADGHDGEPDAGVVLDLDLDGGRVTVLPGSAERALDVVAEVTASAPPAGDAPAATVETRLAVAALVDAAVALVAASERSSGPDDPGRAAALEERAGQLMADGERAMSVEDLRTLVRCIDLTTLEGGDTAGRIRALCATARRPHALDPTVGPVAAVCVYPALAGLVAELLADSPVRTASVAGAFPSGLTTPAVRRADIEAAVATGADEIDVVLDRSAFLDGRLDDVSEALADARRVVADRELKVILEVGELGSYTAIRDAAAMAMDAGADFVKTSTGKIAGGATPAAALCIAEAIADHHARTGRRVGLKVSGGVRDTTTAAGYLHLLRTAVGPEWAGPDLFRIGASSLLGDVTATIDRSSHPA